MPISCSSAGEGSSSTMIAMFRISLRNRRGIERSASATSFSNAARSTGASFRLFDFPALRRLSVPDARDHQAEIIAVVAHDALVAQRLRPADPAAVQDQGVR